MLVMFTDTAEPKQTRSKPEADPQQGRSRAEAGPKQGRSRSAANRSNPEQRNPFQQATDGRSGRLALRLRAKFILEAQRIDTPGV